MADALKNLLPAGVDWLVKVIAEDSADFEYLFDSENAELNNSIHKFKLPRQIPILPIRNAVAYPGTITPLAIGRSSSKRLIKGIKTNKSIIGLVTQRSPQTDDPDFNDLYTVGTAATVLKVIKMPQGSIHVVVHGIARFKITKKISKKPYLKATVKLLDTKIRMTKRLQALIVNIRQMANRVIELSHNVPEEASVLLENIENPSALADFLAANLNISIPEKQKLLEELDTAKRLEKVSVAMANQLEVLEMSYKIQGKVRDSIDKSQREYFLQEQLKAIQTELGQTDRHSEELKQIGKNIKKAKMPENVEEEALRELDRLSKIPSVSPEYSVIRTYLDWVCELPWAI